MVAGARVRQLRRRRVIFVGEPLDDCAPPECTIARQSPRISAYTARTRLSGPPSLGPPRRTAEKSTASKNVLLVIAAVQSMTRRCEDEIWKFVTFFRLLISTLHKSRSGTHEWPTFVFLISSLEWVCTFGWNDSSLLPFESECQQRPSMSVLTTELIYVRLIWATISMVCWFACWSKHFCWFSWFDELIF